MVVIKVNTRFLLINFTLELVRVNTNLDLVTDLTENTTEKITKIKIGSLFCTPLPPVMK